MVRSARARAKSKGLEFNLTMESVSIPTVCPVLGITIVPFGDGVGFQDASPSLDRIDNAKGYTADNVIVVSWRANRIKCDATVDEMRRLYEFYSERAAA